LVSAVLFEVRPPIDEQMEANGYVYGEPMPCGSVPYYRQQHADVDADMGALPRVAVEHGALRGNHPFNGFCAVGPAAADVIAAQTPDDTYGPVAAAAERGGKLLLIGVDLNRATCLHHAESLAGRRQFTRWYCDGDVMRSARTGGCSAAFDAFIPFVTAPRQHVVSGSTWSVFDIATLVEEVRSAVAGDPLLGLCSSDRCHKCPSARARIT
jgi:aminoglycoside 3-N-acetyltransferase